jgi:hypothetical protein
VAAMAEEMTTLLEEVEALEALTILAVMAGEMTTLLEEVEARTTPEAKATAMAEEMTTLLEEAEALEALIVLAARVAAMAEAATTPLGEEEAEEDLEGLQADLQEDHQTSRVDLASQGSSRRVFKQVCSTNSGYPIALYDLQEMN